MEIKGDRVIMVSPPMNHKAGVTKRREGPSANATLAKTRAYAKTCMDIARELSMGRLDLFKVMETSVSQVSHLDC
jgi:hypothetical protein